MNLLARRNRRYRALHAGLNDPLTVVLGPGLYKILSRGPREAPREGVSDERVRETQREWAVGVKYISCARALDLFSCRFTQHLQLSTLFSTPADR